MKGRILNVLLTGFPILVAGFVSAETIVCFSKCDLNITEDMRQRLIEESKMVVNDDSYLWEPEQKEPKVIRVKDKTDRFATAEHTWEEVTDEETEPVTETNEFAWYLNDYVPPQVPLLTADEEIILQKLAAAEGRTMGATGMAHIMRVVLNRVDSEQFPNSIAEVVFQPDQFSVVTSGAYYTEEIGADTEQALDMIESGWDETYGATFFCTEESADNWHRQVLTEMYQYENVIFWSYLAEH